MAKKENSEENLRDIKLKEHFKKHWKAYLILLISIVVGIIGYYVFIDKLPLETCGWDCWRFGK